MTATSIVRGHLGLIFHSVACRRATAAILSIAMTAATATAQSVSLYERVRLDLFSTSSIANAAYIGNNPAAVAWDGSKLYVGGQYTSAGTGTTAIVQVLNPTATPGLNVTPTFSAAFNQRPTAQTRGYTGLAISGTVLASAWFSSSSINTPITDGVKAFSTTDNSLMWTGNLSAAQIGGVAFDPGYTVSGSNQGGSGVTGLYYTSGRRQLFDTTSGALIFGPSPQPTNGMIINTSPTSTEWRDVDFDPATGNIFSRAINNVSMGIRTGTNLIANQAQTFLVNNSNGQSTSGQNLSFMGGIVDAAGGFSGDVVIWNDRPQGAASAAGGSAYTSAIKLVSTSSSAVAINWNLLSGSTPANGNAFYDFDYDPTTMSVAIVDFQNRYVSIYDLDVDVRTVASGTETAAPLAGTKPLAKQGSGTLVIDQATAAAAGTTYVEQGTLQIGSGGTSGVIGSPVAVTVSSGATLAFNRSDNYGGAIGNTIGGAGGVELRSGALTLTAANSYSGGTLISGGTLSVGSGSTTGAIVGNVTNNGALVFNRSNAATFSGTIAGTGSLAKAGAGSLTLNGDNAYSGSTSVTGGTLFVNGDQSAAAGAVTVAASAALAGTGTVGGSTTIQSGATLSPGLSLDVGTLSFAGGATWNTGGNYNWQLFDATGTAGGVGGWDLAGLGGALTIAATSADPFKINLWTLTGTGPFVSGSAANFDPAQTYTWKIASATGGITGFAADKFLVNTSGTNGTGGFANGFSGGTFSVAQSGNDLNLVYSVGGPSVITINVPSGTQTQTQAGYPTLSGSIPVVKTGDGTLVVDQANTLTASTTVQGGVLQLANGSALASSTLAVVAGGTASVANSLTTTVGGLDLSGDGLVDVTSGFVTVASGLSATELVTQIIAGRNNGLWTGTSGITSSVAAAEVASLTPRAVGWLDNGDGSVAFAYAAPGDTNLDWQVNVLDAANMLTAGTFNTGSPATWKQGDFNYDGVVDVLDAADFIATGLYNQGIYNAAPGAVPGAVGAVAAVPEPSTWMVFAGGFAALVSGAGRCRRGGRRSP